MKQFDNYNDYIPYINNAFINSPTYVLKEQYKILKKKNIDIIDFSNLEIKLSKEWNETKENNVQFFVTVHNEIANSNISTVIDNNFFVQAIQHIKTNANYKSAHIFINVNGQVINVEYLSDKINITELISFSLEYKTTSLFLGIRGIDLVIDGILVNTENHLNNYKDLINSRTYSICDYKTMLKDFYDKRIKYDPSKIIFARKNNIPKIHHNLLEKHNKLLNNAPEEIFQRELNYFLKEYCKETVITEARNINNERYDIWIITDEKEIYIIEIKWLGKSISVEGKINDKYNREDRFLDGAYQIKDYIDNTNKYYQIGLEDKIFLAILLTYDAREDCTNIPSFPDEFKSYSNIDLNSQHYILEKDKISASNVHNNLKKISKKLAKGTN